MSRGLERRVTDLEAKIRSVLKDAPTPEAVMERVIMKEWLRAWEGTGPECIEAAWEDYIARLKACPTTVEYGKLIELYKQVLIDETKRRQDAPPPDDSGEYKEA